MRKIAFLRVTTGLSLVVVGSFVPDRLAAQAAASAGNHEGPHREATPAVGAVRLQSEITLDGSLDEAVWQTAPVATGIRQSQPD